MRDMLQEGFWYHHAEPGYLMLVYWIPDTTPKVPVNASHRVGIGAFVMNDNEEVLFFPLVNLPLSQQLWEHEVFFHISFVVGLI